MLVISALTKLSLLNFAQQIGEILTYLKQENPSFKRKLLEEFLIKHNPTLTNFKTIV
jgi:ribosomal protein S15P/S13E